MKRLLACMLLATSTVYADPPTQSPVSVTLGPKLYRDGDVIEITNVLSTSPRMEQGDRVTVKGRVRLDSEETARLCMYLTQTEGDGLEEAEPSQEVKAECGIHEFELSATIKHRGDLHITFYHSRTGRPFGGVYFGTKAQMKKIADRDLSYYLK